MDEKKESVSIQLPIRTFIHILDVCDVANECVSIVEEEGRAKESTSIVIKSEENGNQRFSGYNGIFSKGTPLVDVFESTVKPSIDNFLFKGFGASIISYGLCGAERNDLFEGTPDDPGLIRQTSEYIFEVIKRSPKRFRYLIRLSWCLLYKEECFDILSKVNVKNKVNLRESKNPKEYYMEGLTKFLCKSTNQFESAIRRGMMQRKDFFKPQFSSHLYKSHTIFDIEVQSVEEFEGERDSRTCRKGSIRFVRLADSEKQPAPKASLGERNNREVMKIYWGLNAFRKVVMGLSFEKKGLYSFRHIPDRDSKLTKLLMGSLGGVNCHTTFITSIPDDPEQASEIQGIMKLSQRVGKISNKYDPHSGVNLKKLPLRSTLSILSDKVEELAEKARKREEEGIRKQSDEYLKKKIRQMRSYILSGTGMEEQAQRDLKERMDSFREGDKIKTEFQVLCLVFSGRHLWSYPMIFFL